MSSFDSRYPREFVIDNGKQGYKKDFVFSSVGDANDICYYLGTDFYRQAWSNPANGPYLTVRAYRQLLTETTRVEFTNRAADNTFGSTTNIYTYITFDFNGVKVSPNGVSVLGRSSSMSVQRPRGFKVLGSNDYVNFTELTTIGNGTTDLLTQDGVYPTTMVHFPFTPVNNTLYKYILLWMYTQNSSNNWYMQVSEVEWYGRMERDL